MKRALRQEHQPAGITEDRLIEKMALSFWLSRRAVICQAVWFDLAPDALRGLQKERRQKEADAQIGFVLSATEEELFDQHIASSLPRSARP